MNGQRICEGFNGGGGARQAKFSHPFCIRSRLFLNWHNVLVSLRASLTFVRVAVSSFYPEGALPGTR